jgi:hypothetical protein
MSNMMLMPGMPKALIEAQAVKTKSSLRRGTKEEKNSDVQTKTSVVTTTTTSTTAKEKVDGKGKGKEKQVTPLPKFDLRNIEDVRNLVRRLNQSHQIKYLKQDAATPEQCITLLLACPPDKAITGVVGVGTENNYTKRLRDGSEFVNYLEQGTVYEQEVMALGNHSFDYSTNISVIVHFDDEQFKGEGKIPDNLDDQVEVSLVCCNFTVVSSKLKLTRHTNGSILGVAFLLRAPNLFPLRHLVHSLPSRLMIRERGRLITQVDVHMHNIMAKTLLTEHWFMTPGNLPVCVKNGMCIFQRQEFLNNVPKEFVHRYELRNEDVRDNHY